MRTWEEILTCLRNSEMDNGNYYTNDEGEKIYTDKYKTFVEEVVFHISVKVKVMNAEVVTYDFDYNSIDFALKCNNKLYALRIYIWSPIFRISAVDNMNDYFTHSNWYKTKKIVVTPVNFENPFSKVKLPKHTEFKLNDIVYLKSTTPYYKKYHDFYKVFKITNVLNYGKKIFYGVDSIGPYSATYSRYAESNLKKLNNGL